MPAFFRVAGAVFFSEPKPPEMDALPMAQLRLLMAVHHNQGEPMREFSRFLNISQSSVTKLADALVKRGMLVRVQDESDRRLVRLSCSPSADRMLARGGERAVKTFHLIWEELKDEEREVVLGALETLAVAAEAVRARQGIPLPPVPGCGKERPYSQELPEADRVIDLMARGVRGRASGRKGRGGP
jgi:DNA-binding MarR family transcriptional regulator